jgi:hypothetical protein
LEGILFVLEAGIAWKKLPSELGFGSGITCWRRLRTWQQAGVWDELHRRVLDRLGQQGPLDWSRPAWIRSASGQKGGELIGPNPVDRGKNGTKSPCSSPPTASHSPSRSAAPTGTTACSMCMHAGAAWRDVAE